VVAEVLRRYQADEVLLSLCSRNYWWNVVGGQFMQLRKLFEELSALSLRNADRCAEKIRGIGQRTIGSDFREYTKYSHFMQDNSSKEGEMKDADGMLRELLLWNEKMADSLAVEFKVVEKELDDPVTALFLLELLSQHQNAIWRIKSHLQPTPVQKT